MLDVNVYHFIMMHKVFVPWMIEERALKGFKSVIIGTSSVSANKFLPNFATQYIASKSASANVSRAIAAEMKN